MLYNNNNNNTHTQKKKKEQRRRHIKADCCCSALALCSREYAMPLLFLFLFSFFFSFFFRCYLSSPTLLVSLRNGKQRFALCIQFSKGSVVRVESGFLFKYTYTTRHT